MLCQLVWITRLRHQDNTGVKEVFGDHLTTGEGNNDSKAVMLDDVPTFSEKIAIHSIWKT